MFLIIGCRIFNNADWWGGVKAVEFVSDITRHFRVSSMLAKERYDTDAVV
jgi:tyrosyl-tRNA synthetase